MEKKKNKYPSQIDSQISQVLIPQSLQGFNDGRFIIMLTKLPKKKRVKLLNKKLLIYMGVHKLEVNYPPKTKN